MRHSRTGFRRGLITPVDPGNAQRERQEAVPPPADLPQVGRNQPGLFAKATRRELRNMLPGNYSLGPQMQRRESFGILNSTMPWTTVSVRAGTGAGVVAMVKPPG